MSKRLTTKAYRMARQMNAVGLPMGEIVSVFNGVYTERDIAAALAEKRDYVSRPSPSIVPIIADRVDVDPAAIEFQRRRQMLRHRDVTSLLCGDPLPGESALDRRMATV